MKDFNIWNQVKIILDKIQKRLFFKERDIFFTSLGENIGFEQNGKGRDFMRPVLIVKKFNNEVFFGIPLSKTKRRGKYYFEFDYTSKFKSVALLSQLRLFDAKRLKYKSGTMNLEDFENIKKAIKNIF